VKAFCHNLKLGLGAGVEFLSAEMIADPWLKISVELSLQRDRNAALLPFFFVRAKNKALQ